MNEPHLDRLLERYPALEPCRASVHATYLALAAVFERGHKLLVCGNGGSAADAEHIVGELMKGFLLPRPVPEKHRIGLKHLAGPAGEELAGLLQGSLRAISLASHGSLATAVANDTRGDMVFAQQLYGLGRPGDAVLGISTSGNSQNIVNAFHVAKLLGLRTFLLTGQSGGRLAPLADIAIRAPAQSVVEIQEFHLPIYHALCGALEARFFGR